MTAASNASVGNHRRSATLLLHVMTAFDRSGARQIIGTMRVIRDGAS